MSTYIINHYWLITQKINGEVNYFCNWERLHDSSPVFGIVWDTDINYAHIFTDKTQARAERGRMYKYDSRGNYKVRKMKGNPPGILKKIF